MAKRKLKFRILLVCSRIKLTICGGGDVSWFCCADKSKNKFSKVELSPDIKGF